MKKFSKRLLSVLLVIAMLIPTCAMAVTTSAATVSIPDDAIVFNGHYYKVFNESLSWTDAKTACEKMGGHLLTITSQAEQEFITEKFLTDKPQKRFYYLGGYRDNEISSWKWITDESFRFFNWHEGEAEQTINGQNYMIMSSSAETIVSTSKWLSHFDSLFNENYWSTYNIGYICEWESGEHFPDGYDPLLDKYGFTNPSQVVESKIYETVYGTVKGAYLSFVHENNKAHGLCYGMASTTAALLQNRSAISSFSLLSPDMNFGNVDFISSIFDSAFSNLFNMNIINFVKYGYVYQFATDRDSTINDLRNLYFSIESYVNGRGSAVVISIWHGTKNNRKHGHAILATGIKETADDFIILIDDSNFMTQTELSISKDFSTWRYSVDGTTLSDGTPYDYNSSNGIISYDIPGNVVYNLGLLAGEKTRSATNYLNENRLLVTSTSSFGENDNLSEIFVTEELGSEINDSRKLYWIDEDVHSIELSAEDDDSEVTVSDVNSSVSAILDSKENASFYVDDDSVNKVSYSSEKDKNAIVVFSSVDEKGEIVTTTLTGTANGDEVVATETEDGIQVTGLNDITVTYETADGTAETKADVKDGSTVNITVNDDENTVETDWQAKQPDSDETDSQCKHADTNYDGICDGCGDDFTADCGHTCHSKNSFVQFFWKIINIIQKLFGVKSAQYCNCGKAHW